MARRGFSIGLDLGSTWVSAAIREHGSPARPIAIGRDGPAPAALAVAADGTVLVGDAAERQAITDPARVLRHVPLRAADPVPVVLAGRRLAAGETVKLLLTRIVETVSDRLSGPADAVAVAHPAWWGAGELEPVRAALSGVTTMPAPVAVVAAGGRPGGLVAVLDVDAGLTASVARAGSPGAGSGFGSSPGELLGPPIVVPHPADPAIVDPVFAHLRRLLDGVWPRLDPRDPVVRGAVAELRRRCAQAAAALTTRPSTHVVVDLPGLHTRLPVDRGAVVELVLLAADEVAEILDEALDAADVAPADLDEVVVTGGAARSPLVVEAVGAALGRRVVPARLPVAALGAAGLCRAPAPAAPPAEGGADADYGLPRPARHRATPHRRGRLVAAAVAAVDTATASSRPRRTA